MEVGAGTNRKVAAVVRPISNRQKRTPEANAPAIVVETSSPMTYRRLSTNRTLVSSIDRAIKIQFDGCLLMDKCQPNSAKNCGKSALFHRFTQWKQLSIHADSRRFKEEESPICSTNA